MRPILLVLMIFIFLLAACGPSTPATAPVQPAQTAISSPTPGATATATETLAPEATATPTLAPTPQYPPEGYGPLGFPEDINPLTGLKVTDPALLDRRPLIIKVSNLPRYVRPQWGLSLADHVYEYYTEEGTTRFAAIFYGQDASTVGPIRSARLVDHHLINMYKANFSFGSADYRVRKLLFNQDYSDRLVIESACPPMCRFEPKGVNQLIANTADLTTFIASKKVPGGNKRQNLDGILFRYESPMVGDPGASLSIRYSPAIYNLWTYDTAIGKYTRSVDGADDLSGGAGETYVPHSDRLTNQPITADNVVVLYVTHAYVSRAPEIVDIILSGPGKAYLFRDGQVFSLTWYRNGLDQLLLFATADGKYFPLKPGNTWFEVVGSSTKATQTGDSWRFNFTIP